MTYGVKKVVLVLLTVFFCGLYLVIRNAGGNLEAPPVNSNVVLLSRQPDEIVTPLPAQGVFVSREGRLNVIRRTSTLAESVTRSTYSPGPLDGIEDHRDEIDKEDDDDEVDDKEKRFRSTKPHSTRAPVIYTTQAPYPLVNTSWSPTPTFRNRMVDCSKLFIGKDEHPMSVQRAKRLQTAKMLHSRFLTPKQLYKGTENCSQFIANRKYVMNSITQEEEDFPIAYSIVMYYAPGQAERLLRAIYRPQNYYCLHIDSKAGLETELSMQRLADCFANVFVVPNPTSVNWAYYGVLQAEIICMEHLIKYKKWKYFINLTGHEFPLKSNYEIVQILKIYNGSNEISNLPIRNFQDRWHYVHTSGRGKTDIEKDPPPFNMTIHKGDAHVTLSRAFVEYILSDPVAIQFREWTKDVYCPEEIFFPSLHYNTHLRAPGGFSKQVKYYYKVVSRHKVWMSEGPRKCKSKNYRHIICIYGVDDLPDLGSDYKAMFINKLMDDYEPYTYDCLEELFFNRTRDEYLGIKGFDLNYFMRRPFVENHF